MLQTANDTANAIINQSVICIKAQNSRVDVVVEGHDYADRGVVIGVVAAALSGNIGPCQIYRTLVEVRARVVIGMELEMRGPVGALAVLIRRSYTFVSASP